MARHNIIKTKGLQIIQELANADFDYSSIPAIMPDSIGNFDATLQKSNNLYFNLEGRLTYPDGLVDFNSDFTIIWNLNISILGTSFMFLIDSVGSTDLRFSINESKLTLHLNGGKYRAATETLTTGNNTVTLKRNGDLYVVIVNTVTVFTQSYSGLITGLGWKTIDTATGLRPDMLDVAFFTENVIAVDVYVIAKDSKAIRSLAILKAVNSHYFGFSEGEGNKTFDIISGAEALLDGNQTWNLSDTKIFHNLEFGFSLFKLNADNSIKKRVPRKYDETSFNKTITDYTLEEEILPSINTLPNSEGHVVQPDSLKTEIGDDNFWFSGGVAIPRTFTEIKDNTDDKINYTLVTSNIMSNIKTSK